MRALPLLLVVILLVACVTASEKAGTAALPFLRLGVGARALAMGEAYAAGAVGAEAAVLNPAALGNLSRYQVSFTHDIHLLDTSFDYGAFALPLAEGRAGGAALAVRYLSYGEMQGYDEHGVPTDTFTAGDLALGLAYGIPLFPGFCAGVGLNYLYSKLDDVTANGFSVDLGLLYQPLERLRVGFVAQNLGPSVTYETLESPLPAVLRLGAAGEVFNNPRHRITLAADGVYPFYSDPYGALGLQYTLYDTVSLRGGYRVEHDTAGLSFGAGLHFYLWERVLLDVDYAYVDYGELQASHLFSLNIGF